MKKNDFEDELTGLNNAKIIVNTAIFYFALFIFIISANVEYDKKEALKKNLVAANSIEIRK